MSFGSRFYLLFTLCSQCSLHCQPQYILYFCRNLIINQTSAKLKTPSGEIKCFFFFTLLTWIYDVFYRLDHEQKIRSTSQLTKSVVTNLRSQSCQLAKLDFLFKMSQTRVKSITNDCCQTCTDLIPACSDICINNMRSSQLSKLCCSGCTAFRVWFEMLSPDLTADWFRCWLNNTEISQFWVILSQIIKGFLEQFLLDQLWFAIFKAKMWIFIKNTWYIE